MPTVITHPVAAIALAPWFRRHIPSRAAVVGAICTIVPDGDVAAFGFGIPYAHPLGHRGFSHSILFALLLGAFVAVAFRTFAKRDAPVLSLFVYFTVCTLSHGVLDAFTNGGKGVGFFIPFDNARYFFPVTPIRVSPIGVEGFVARGVPVLVSEATWVWLPAALLFVAGIVVARRTHRVR